MLLDGAGKGFERVIAIDWSGTKGPRYKGIAVAEAVGKDAPRLVTPPGGGWTRKKVHDFILRAVGEGRVLVGYDFSPALPFADRGAYFEGGPDNARDLWRLVNEISGGAPDFFGGAFTTHPDHAASFWRGNPKPAGFDERLRVTEVRCRDQGLGQAQSVYKLIGPAQVGKASLAGMRVFHHLDANCRRQCAFWPFDEDTGDCAVMVEVFPRVFLKRAKCGNKKIRSAADASEVWTLYKSDPPGCQANQSDHAWDALVTAAGLRHQARVKENWKPPGMSREIAMTEGWIFGVS